VLEPCCVGCHDVCGRFCAMLSGEYFEDVFDAADQFGASNAIVLFLATFMPIGKLWGKGAVESSMAEVIRRVVGLAGDCAVLRLGFPSIVVLVPGLVDVSELNQRLAEEFQACELETSDGYSIDLKLAIGNSAVGEDGLHAAVSEAASNAEADLSSRYPSEWEYPIVLPNI